MNSFEDIIHTINYILHKLDSTKCLCYIINDNPDLRLLIAKPGAFDNYSDVLARITLLHKNKIIIDGLITIETNMEKFCNKLSQKIKENNYG